MIRSSYIMKSLPRTILYCKLYETGNITCNARINRHCHTRTNMAIIGRTFNENNIRAVPTYCWIIIIIIRHDRTRVAARRRWRHELFSSTSSLGETSWKRHCDRRSGRLRVPPPPTLRRVFATTILILLLQHNSLRPLFWTTTDVLKTTRNVLTSRHTLLVEKRPARFRFYYDRVFSTRLNISSSG